MTTATMGRLAVSPIMRTPTTPVLLRHCAGSRAALGARGDSRRFDRPRCECAVLAAGAFGKVPECIRGHFSGFVARWTDA